MDFHTSELIGGVGARFNAAEFAGTLAKARVNQVCCFARCHHGWLYYDSKANPERIHPNLTNRDILVQQVDACHNEGIRVPIYTTVQWDHYSATRHADWLCRDHHGRTLDMVGRDHGPAGFYTYLCVGNKDYVGFLEEHIRDIYDSIPSVDGIFLDIMWQIPCACPSCWASMEALGMNPLLSEDRNSHALITLDKFMSRMSAYIRGFDPNASIYYNSGAIRPNNRGSLPSFSHLEFDALPGESGYSHIQSRRYERTLGLDCVAMTGKFHKGWGDFHSFKNPAALQYECFQALALNLKCLVGDQLHPTGRLEPAIYDLIGGVYAEVEKKESWCRNARPITDIGILATGRSCTGGAVSMLIASGHQFDILDEGSDFNGYKVLILPDRLSVSPDLAARIDAYVAAGGKVLCSFEAGYDAGIRDFVLDGMPVAFASDGPIFDDGKPVRGRYLERTAYGDYLIPTDTIGRSLPKAEHVMYARGVEVSAAADSEVLVWQIKPYFDRTQARFSSHQQIPSSGERGYPAVVRKGGVIYFGHPVFDIYNSYAPAWVKAMVMDALALLLPEPVFRHDGPSTLEATVNAQDDEKRLVVHLLHYIPINRAERVEIVEDVIPLYGIGVSVRIPEGSDIRSIRSVPGGEGLPFAISEGRVGFTVPKLEGHQMVEINMG